MTLTFLAQSWISVIEISQESRVSLMWKEIQYLKPTREAPHIPLEWTLCCLVDGSMAVQPWQFAKDVVVLGSYNHIFCPINVKKD
jgi:hypothetical protein